MPSPYRVNVPGGVVIIATNQIIHPGDPEWLVYEAYLVANLPPLPGAADVQAYIAPVLTVAQQRTEARARLHGALELQGFTPSVLVAGFRYSITFPAIIEYTLQRVRVPPFGVLRMPDIDGVYHNVTSNNLDDIIKGAADYHRALFTWAEAKRAAIDASLTPLTIPLNDYPLPP